MLMQRAGVVGRSGARKRYGIPSIATADDLVDRMFVRERPNQLWVTDIERHEALSNRAVVKGRRLRSVAAGR
jgi:transposase InsO family protein